MSLDVLSNLQSPQRARLDRFSIEHSVDIHCHCLPGLDDGAATMSDALDLCRALVADGVTAVIATPHQLGAYFGRNWCDTIRTAVSQLREELAANNIPLQIKPGADVRVDDQIIRLMIDGNVMTLGDGGSYILLELPHQTVIRMEPLIKSLKTMGVTAIISHPERNEEICNRPEVVRGWRECGAELQITGASLLGKFGSKAQRTAWGLVEAGLASIVASDAHGAKLRSPVMTRAIAAIEGRIGFAAARRLCVENPFSVYEGKPIVQRPAVSGAGWRNGRKS
jgi:protein-tyrosine phosphatase